MPVLRNLALGVGLTMGLAIVTVQQAGAGQLVYKPISPNFGGNPFMASPLLAEAQLQNRFEDSGSSFSPSDPIDDFADTLQRRLLSELSRDITDAIFGEDAQESGSFQVEDTLIEFEQVGDQIQVTIEGGDGSSTSISLPTPSF